MPRGRGELAILLYFPTLMAAFFSLGTPQAITALLSKGAEQTENSGVFCEPKETRTEPQVGDKVQLLARPVDSCPLGQPLPLRAADDTMNCRFEATPAETG